MVTNKNSALNSGFAEETASHSIRANHELIENICLSRMASDRVNDDFPEIIAMMGADGAILRGNKVLAALMEVELDDIIDFNFESLFTSSSWKIFLNELERGKGSNSFSFELPLDGLAEQIAIFWTVSKFTGISDRRGVTWAVLGTDITRQRLAESRLATVFAAIPLGVMTVNREGLIEWPYSNYCEVLLDCGDLTGRTIEDGLFGRSLSKMSIFEKEKIRFLKGVFGQDFSWFEMIRSQLPVEVPVEASDGKLVWVGMSYSPVINEEVIEKMLIVIEDITKRVIDREQSKTRDSKELKISRLISDLQEAEPEYIESAIEDIDGYMKTLGDVVDKVLGRKNFCACLHGIKGVARTINLSDFKVFVHDMESRLLADSDNVDAQSGGLLLAEFASLRNEWAQIRNYSNIMRSAENLAIKDNNDSKKIGLLQLQKAKESILHHFDKVLQMQDDGGRSKSLLEELNALRESVRRIGYIKAESIADKLQFICASTAKKLGKNVELNLRFNGVEFSLDALSKLTEVFLHLITNALDHAIESPETRKALGKNEIGKISVRLEQVFEHTCLCEFVDDGSGIDLDKVKAIAEKKGILQSVDKISRFEAMNLILRSNFSTATAVTETSGRGIGLSAAVEAINTLNPVEGLRVVSSELGKGTVFSFTIKP